MDHHREIHLAGEEYVQLKEELKHSILLETDQSVTLADVLAKIPSDKTQWSAGYISPGKFLIRAPIPWRRQAVVRGDADIGGTRFIVHRNITEVSTQSDWKKVWVRLRGLPYELRGLDTISEIVTDFGRFVEVDYNTNNNLDLRWARVAVMVPDESVIPPIVSFKIENGCDKEKVYYVPVEAENVLLEPLLNISPMREIPQNISQASTAGNLSSPFVPIINHPPIPEHAPIPEQYSCNYCYDHAPPYIIQPDDVVYASLFHTHPHFIQTNPILEYFCAQPPNLVREHDAGTSRSQGTATSSQKLDAEFNLHETVADDQSTEVQEESLGEAGSGQVIERKRRMKRKICASKRRINFASSARQDAHPMGGPYAATAGIPCSAPTVVTHEGNPARTKNGDNGTASGGDWNTNLDSKDINHFFANGDSSGEDAPVVTPQPVAGFRRSSVRMACINMMNAKDRRKLRASSYSAHVDAIVLDDDSDGDCNAPKTYP